MMKLMMQGILLVLLTGVILQACAPCPTEDSPGCTWYGPLQGNKVGSIVINP